MSDIIVDLSRTKSFTDKHLDIVKDIYEKHWKEFYPELFGDKLPDAIKFSHFELIPTDITKNGSQIHRSGGKSTKFKEVYQNIERNGFKLKYPPVSLFRWSYAQDGDEIITGFTRSEVFTILGIKYFVAAIYVKNPGYTDNQVRDALIVCGQSFNAVHDPSSPLSKEDVKRAVNLSISLFQKTGGEAGIPATLTDIVKRIELLCGEGIFQPKTRTDMALEIYNNYNPHDVVVSWADNKNAEYRISAFMFDNKLLNTDKVKYIYTTFDTPSKAFTRACKIASDNPKSEVRILIHTSTLSGYDLEKTYKSRVREFVANFNNIINEVSGASDNKATFNRIKIYAALPALGACHDLNIPFYIDVKKSKAYQKNDNVKSFDLVEDDIPNLLTEIESYDQAA